jgi:hypothetical protein
MVRDGQNGAILAWVDYRSSFSNPEIFGFRILADGTYPIGPPILKLSERAVTFGVVDIGRIRTENITLRNTGGSPVTIASITSSDPHFSLTPDNSTIPPNSSISAVLRFQPTTKDVLSASIVIESNSIFGPDTIFVTGAGSGSAAIEIDRTALNFGEVNMGSSRALAMNVSNPGNDTLRITSVTTSNPRFTVDITTKVLAPGEAFEDTVRFTPTDAGPVSATLALTSNAPDSPTILQLTGTGKVVVVIEVTMTIDPAEITFGEVTVGLQKDTTVTVTNTGNDTLRISEFASDDPRFTLLTALTDIAPTESQTLTLRFAPDAVGPFSSVFLVTSNAVTSPDTIAVQGTGREVTAVRALQVFPGAFTLYPNYPNPFHPATTIRYDLETSAPVSVTVLNRLGQVTSVLVDEMQSPGLHAVQWTPTSVAPGVYFYVLRVGAYKAYGRMVLMP